MVPPHLLLRLALRNVRRNARRSVLTASAMVLGLALLVFSRSIADGGHEDWITSAVRMGDGHVVLESPGFARTRDLADRLTPAALAAVDTAVASDRVTRVARAVAPRLAVPALASAAAAAVPVMAIGVDPAAEATFSILPGKRIAGRSLAPGDDGLAYIGERLARRLGLSVGSRFVVSAQDAAGQIGDQLLRVAGIFRTGVPDADEGLIQLPLGTAQRWLRAGGAVTSVAVLLRSSGDVNEVVRALRSDLRARTDVTVLGWRQAMPELDSAVRLDDDGDYLIHGILFAIIGLAIVNTMLMSVLNRLREFGILRALGLTPFQTGSLVFIEGLVLTAASGLVGLVLGAAGTWLLFRHGLDYSALMSGNITMAGTIVSPVIVPILGPSQLLQSVTYIAAVGILAALYPAYRATRIDIVEAMKFDA